MTDRELLEFAAKSAGLKPSESDGVIYAGFGSMEWNPLADDGDALRLAVKLSMSVTIGPLEVSATTIQGALSGFFPKEEMIFQEDAAATRRAIVRAAASIGEQMK